MTSDTLDQRIRAYVDDNLVNPTERDYLFALNCALIGNNLAMEEEIALRRKMRREVEASGEPSTSP